MLAKLLLLSLSVVLVAGQNGSSTVERECGCPKNGGGLWLDISIIFDVSASMSHDEVTQAVADVSGVFGTTTINQNGGQSTRIGVVTYAETGSVFYNLTHFSSNDQFMDEIWNVLDIPSTNTLSYVREGLFAGMNMLTDGRKNNIRTNVVQVLIIYTSVFTTKDGESPFVLADQFKDYGGYIITVAVDQGGDQSVIDNLKKIASPGMAFTNKDKTPLIGEIQQALCQANCFCPDTWTQYGNALVKPTKTFGSCLKLATLSATWTPSSHACNALSQGGHLVSEFDSKKHDFTVAMAKSDPTFLGQHAYHIGLKYSNGAFNWVQASGKPVVPLSASGYTNWCPGYPSGLDSGSTCVMETPVDTKELDICWQTINCNTVDVRYICEAIACDATNYCPS